jgi:segregation and condensation protein B
MFHSVTYCLYQSEKREDAHVNIEERMSVIESLLFASSTPLKVREIAATMGIDEETSVRLVEMVADRLKEHGHGVQVVRVAGGYQMTTVPENAFFVSQLSRLEERRSLSPAAIETLAVVAYRQPVTRAEIEAVRGVQCAGVLANLVARGLIEEKGRKETVGRPLIYGTTEAFLRAFGLDSPADLPPLTGVDAPADLLQAAASLDPDSSRRGDE